MAFQINKVKANITRSRSGHSTLTIRAYGIASANGREWACDKVVYKAVKLNGPEQAANLARAFKERRDADYLQQYSDGAFQGFVYEMPDGSLAQKPCNAQFKTSIAVLNSLRLNGAA